MTSRGRSAIENRIRSCKERAAFIPFVSAGDPDLETSFKIIIELAKYADVIEIGIPYSDPLADGPVIQAGSLRAIQAGMTLPKALALISRVRQHTDVPLIAFTYVNPVIQYGYEKLAEECRKAGADGLIVPDLPYEESHELRQAAQKFDLAVIPLVSLTSDKRIEKIVGEASGFVYCVSSLGVTGERGGFSDRLQDFVETVKSVSTVPVAVGFGVGSPEQVALLSGFADAVIVGSALVRRCGDIGAALRAGDEALANRLLEDFSRFSKELSAAAIREGKKGE